MTQNRIEEFIDRMTDLELEAGVLKDEIKTTTRQLEIAKGLYQLSLALTIVSCSVAVGLAFTANPWTGTAIILFLLFDKCRDFASDNVNVYELNVNLARTQYQLLHQKAIRNRVEFAPILSEENNDDYSV